ncbi:hypothetical protein [Halorubrum salinarum]|uniref:hypothetical protein n=1 Tax=Halorubrum salinarum TaxID=2739057 RepID=UPI001F2452CE|nr:hypothetical protein [Halorubrum salinarum]
MTTYNHEKSDKYVYLNEHVGDEKNPVNRSDAVRALVRETLDSLDVIDGRHGRVETAEVYLGSL